MATPQKEKDHQLSISSLLSPPESRRADTFSSPMSVAMSRTPSASFSSTSYPAQSSNFTKLAGKHSRPVLLSPPISPQTPQKDEAAREDEGAKDPPLFPSQESGTSENNGPLFPRAESADADSTGATIQNHIAKAGRDPSSLPSEEEYRLIVDAVSQIKFHSIVGEQVNKDPAKWIRREMSTWHLYPGMNAGKVNQKKVVKSGLRRLAPAPSGVRKSKVTVPRVARNPKPKRSPPQHQFDDFDFPLRSPQVPKAPKAPTSRDDVDYESQPDYCPPIDSLPNNSKALKADWKGQMLDLCRDPDRHLLHESEVNLAATLRLSCATYLTSKRRIFVARLHTLKIGKEFRKTDAQQACKIDVNKASKLWTAFEKVGWFESKWFIKFIH